jgi:phage-related protein
MAERKLNVKITGDAKEAIGAMSATGGEADKMGGKFAHVGKLIAGAAALTAVAAVGIAGKSADTFAKVGGEVLKLQRYTGDTAEASSRMRTAFQLSGIDVDAASKSLGIFSKNVVSGKVEKMGIEVRDATGHLKPMNSILMESADKFKSMPNGIEKTNLALQLFGKSGAEMTKFLSRGADGISELEKKSDEYGLTLSGKNLDAVKKSIGAHREQKAAMEGLQVQIGIYVLPIITKLTTFIARELPKATHYFQELAEKAGPLVERLKAGLAPAMESVQSAFRRVAEVVAPIVAWFQRLIERNPATSLKVLGGVVGTILVVAFTAWAVSAASAAVATLAAAAPVLLVIAAVAALAAGLYYAYNHFQSFRNVVDTVARFLKDVVWPAIAAFARNVADAFGQMVGWVRQHWGEIRAVISTVVSVIRAVISNFIGTVQAAWHMFGSTILTYARSAWDAVRQMIQGVMNVIGGIIRLVMAVIHGDWSGAWNAIKQITSGAMQTLRGFIDGGMAAIRAVVSGAWAAIRAVIAGAWNGIYGIVAGGVNNVVGFFNGLPGRIIGAIGNLGSILYQKGQDLIGGLINGIRSAAGSVASAIASAIPGGGILKGLPLPGLPFGAAGGYNPPGMPYLVGENGPEVRIDGPGVIIPNHAIKSGTGTPIAMGGGTVVHVTVNVAGHVQTERDLAESVRSGLIDIGRRTGRPVLAGF